MYIAGYCLKFSFNTLSFFYYLVFRAWWVGLGCIQTICVPTCSGHECLQASNRDANYAANTGSNNIVVRHIDTQHISNSQKKVKSYGCSRSCLAMCRHVKACFE